MKLASDDIRRPIWLRFIFKYSIFFAFLGHFSRCPNVCKVWFILRKNIKVKKISSFWVNNSWTVVNVFDKKSACSLSQEISSLCFHLNKAMLSSMLTHFWRCTCMLYGATQLWKFVGTLSGPDRPRVSPRKRSCLRGGSVHLRTVNDNL